MKTYSLSDFTRFIRRVLALNLPEAPWVEAELGQVSESRGHLFLVLIEKRKDGDEVVARVDAVVWGSRMSELIRKHGLGIRSVFRTGMSVRLRVTADFHDRYGFKLLVEDADLTHTLGRLEQQRREVAARLAAGGYTEMNSALTLPLLTQRIAIISSETAAGYADFRQQLRQNPDRYHYELELFSSAMQGDQAATEMKRSLDRISRHRDRFDAVVIIRGGGARMDLTAFDDEALCQAVARHPLPILTGIGHETDEVLLDRVAHTALKTPTAVAAFLLDRSARLEGTLLRFAAEIEREGRRLGSTAADGIEARERELLLLSRNVCQLANRHLTECSRQIVALQINILDRSTTELDRREDLLTVLRPETTLTRGFAMVSQDGKWIRSSADFDPELETTLRWKDGERNLEQRDQ